MPMALRLIAVVATTALSQAGLWAEAYPDHGHDHGRDPCPGSLGRLGCGHPLAGDEKGHGLQRSRSWEACTFLGLLWEVPPLRVAEGFPVFAAILLGATVFPLIKTIIETFDGSPPFFRRLRAQLP